VDAETLKTFEESGVVKLSSVFMPTQGATSSTPKAS
jgi:hypothetical protein